MKWFISFRSINNSGSEFHKFIVEGKKEYKYESVLAKGVTKCWLCPRVDVESDVRVNETQDHVLFYKI